MPETLQDFGLAEEERYWEGLELMVAGRLGAGIYLMGFAAEMLLKAACFRINGANPRDLTRPMLGPARTEGRAHFPAIDHESYHSLLFWGELLLSRRRRHGGLAPFSPAFRNTFTHCVHSVYSIWWIEMRYRPDQASVADAGQVYEHVSWLRNNHLSLWS